MSLNFTIFDAGEALPDEHLDGPNPAEDSGATNRANGPPVLGNDDGGDVGQENVGNAPVSDQSRSDQKRNHLGRSHGKRACLAELGTAEIGRG